MSTLTEQSVVTMAGAYIEAGYFADVEPEGFYLELGDSERYRIEMDCAKFLVLAGDMVNQSELQRAGHDFYFTRNGHGVGFWDGHLDGSWEGREAQLTVIAELFGTDDTFTLGGEL